VEKGEEEEISYNDKISLKHQITGKYVSLDWCMPILKEIAEGVAL